MGDAGLVIATACDSVYGDRALNLVGSIHRRAEVVDLVRVYDLGMTRRQRARLLGVHGVEVHEVEPFVPHWRVCWSWKPWVWRAASQGARRVLYLDAGMAVNRSLAPVIDDIDERGYFAVSQRQYRGGEHVLAEIVPREWYERFQIPHSLQSAPVVAAGVFGFAVGSPIDRDVVEWCLEMSRAGENLGWSRSELHRNAGLHRMDDPPTRDCALFRHDQSLLTVALHKTVDAVAAHPAARYASTRPRGDSETPPVILHRRGSGHPRDVGALHYLRWRSVKRARNVVRLRLPAMLRRLRRRVRGPGRGLEHGRAGYTADPNDRQRRGS